MRSALVPAVYMMAACMPPQAPLPPLQDTRREPRPPSHRDPPDAEAYAAEDRTDVEEDATRDEASDPIDNLGPTTYSVPMDCQECAQTTPEGYTPLNVVINDGQSNFQLVTSWFDWTPTSSCLELRIRNQGSARSVESFRISLDTALVSLTRPAANADYTDDGRSVFVTPWGKAALFGPGEHDYFRFCGSPAVKPIDMTSLGVALLTSLDDGEPSEVSAWQDPLSALSDKDVHVTTYQGELWSSGICSTIWVSNHGPDLGHLSLTLGLNVALRQFSASSASWSASGDREIAIDDPSPLENGATRSYSACGEPRWWPVSVQLRTPR